MNSQTAITVLWILGAVLALGALAYVGLKWAAFHIARRVAEATERRVAARVNGGLSRTGLDLAGTTDPALRAKYVAQIERLARVMDRLVPLPVVGGVGLDAVLGLVPVAGDLISLGVSSLIVIRAAQLGVPTELLSRLIAIQFTDFVLGAIPVVGDFIDIAYQADVRSARLIREFIDRTTTVTTVTESPAARLPARTTR